jgi:hypothetical protein
MPSRLTSLIALLCLACAALHAQSPPPPRFQFYGGYSYLSNTLNGVPGSRQALNGFDASMAFPSWRGLRFKIDVSGYRGTNLGAPQDPYFIVGGAQYGRRIGREFIFMEAMGGDGGTKKNWGAGGITGTSASFSTLLGGGLDTRLSRHLAFRVVGDFQYMNFYLVTSKFVHYRTPGLPNYFGRASSGLVWQF